jgi:hypothetical protein
MTTPTNEYHCQTLRISIPKYQGPTASMGKPKTNRKVRTFGNPASGHFLLQENQERQEFQEAVEDRMVEDFSVGSEFTANSVFLDYAI